MGGLVPSSAVEILRQQLREKFPQAHGVRSDSGTGAPLGGLFSPALFPAGKVSEVIPASGCSGMTLLIASLLGDPSELSLHPEIVLVDGSDAFDPDSFTGAACSRLLWVRCSTALEMLRAADLLAHDGNLSLVLLDATALPRRELDSVPGSCWWRLSQTIERTGARLVVMAPYRLIPCASLRLSITADFSLRDFDDSRDELVDRIRVSSDRLRHAT